MKNRKKFNRRVDTIRKIARKYDKTLKRAHLLSNPDFIDQVEKQADLAGMSFEFYVQTVIMNHGRPVLDISILATSVGREICHKAKEWAKAYRSQRSSDVARDLKLFERKKRECHGDEIQAFIESSPFMSSQGREIILRRFDERTRSLLKSYLRGLESLGRRSGG